MEKENVENRSEEQVEKSGLLSGELQEKYDQLMMVCDRNMNLNRKIKNYNTDFVLIKNKKGDDHIEPTRDFCLKAISVFCLSYEPVGEPVIVTTTNEILVSRDVRITDGERYVTETGGCSTDETGYSGSRMFHDALAIAMTRATKRGLEALVGLPFVNMMIKELFGRYQAPEGTVPKKKPLPKEAPKPVKDLANEVYQMLVKATDDGIISAKERNTFWNKAQLAMTDFNQLRKEKAAIEDVIEERSKPAF